MRAVLVLVALSGAAAADPRGSASAELRMHVGDSEQDEVAHYGLFPSLVLGGTFAVTEDIDVEAAFAAAKVTATWENIGGLANGYLGARHRRGSLTFGAGVTLPL